MMPPVKKKHEEVRGRKFLYTHEVEKMRKSINGRNRFRDSLLLLMMFRHGFREGEVCELKWEQIDFNTATIFIQRLKGSKSSTHYLQGDEIRTLKKLKRDNNEFQYVFISERKTPLSTRAIRYIVNEAGRKAGIEFQVNAHSLRHATGYKLANDGWDLRMIQDYLGHKNISNTVIYTQLNPERFKRIQW